MAYFTDMLHITTSHEINSKQSRLPCPEALLVSMYARAPRLLPVK